MHCSRKSMVKFSGAFFSIHYFGFIKIFTIFAKNKNNIIWDKLN